MGNCWSFCEECCRRTFPDTRQPSLPYLPRPPTDITDEEDEKASKKVLKVEQVDLCKEENVIHHHTDKFHQIANSLIIRRGTAFKLKIQFQRNFDEEHDTVCLVLSVKDIPMPTYAQETMVLIPVEVEDNSVLPSAGWKAKLLRSDSDGWITIEVMTSAKAIVGEWLLEIDTKTKTENGESTLRYPVLQSTYLLFNPWCEEDQVYMANEGWRKEYVLLDTGLIWKGTYNSLKPTAWSYGQFEEFILEASCFLLRGIGKLSVTARADPVKVSRHISAVVNSPDEGGVVEGRWKPSFRGGQPPTYWTGSQAILQKFYKNKKSVKFGQCWVFAGVCTTVCRCLGIPCRTITNYSSAHDTHNSLTVDYFFDEEGSPVEELNRDSVWNFHVWNEAWMTRPDLGDSSYDGWQVIDATPQEPSDGQYRCGPASVNGVKRGEVLKTYDSTFVFAEVNADKVYWRYHGRNKPLKLIHTATEQIGQLLSTKAVGTYEREDVTDNYKYREHSTEEREVMLRALRLNKTMFSRYYLNDEFEDVEFTFILVDDIVIGSAFTVKLKSKNKGKENKKHKVRAILRVDTVRYTGELNALVMKDNYDFELQPGEEHDVVMKVTYSDYEHALTDQSSFNVSAMATVIDTNFDYFAQDDFRVRMPDITIETEGDIIVGEEFKVIAYFINPLPKQLKKGLFLLEGPGLTQPMAIKLKRPVEANGEARVEATMKPKTSGEKTIIVRFTSKVLDDVDGYKNVVAKSKAASEDGNSHM